MNKHNFNVRSEINENKCIGFRKTEGSSYNILKIVDGRETKMVIHFCRREVREMKLLK